MKINCIKVVNGVKLVSKAELNWSGIINVSIYVPTNSTTSVREFSYIANGSRHLYCRGISQYKKYTRIDFTLEWDKSICNKYCACMIVLSRITKLSVY